VNDCLFIVGGAERPERRKLMGRFVELSGGPSARVAVLPAATGDPRGGLEKMRAWLAGAGLDPERVELLEVSESIPGWERGAYSRAVVEMAERADAVWILGGDQNRILRLLLAPDGAESPLLHALRGKTLGGTSAGAAVMSDPMLGGGTSYGALALPRAGGAADAELSPSLYVTRGLGFFPEGIVDQHFDVRARLARLLEAALVEDGARRLAFGLSEATAMEYSGRERGLRVWGRGGLYVVDPRKASREELPTPSGPRTRIRGALLHLLTEGDRLDLRSGAFDFGEKEELPAGEAALDLAGPSATGALSPYGSLAQLGARALLDNREDCLFLDPESGLRYARSYLFEGPGPEGGPFPAWELRLYRLPGESALYYGDDYSFRSVRLDLLPLELSMHFYP
jgi:cyanophycinase